MIDNPEPGKVYKLTGGKAEASILNGNSWKESEVGIDSLLNGSKLDYRRGDKIKFLDQFGKVQKGKYVMASSIEGYVVLNMGGKHGTPKVVSISKIIK